MIVTVTGPLEEGTGTEDSGFPCGAVFLALEEIGMVIVLKLVLAKYKQ